MKKNIELTKILMNIVQHMSKTYKSIHKLFFRNLKIIVYVANLLNKIFEYLKDIMEKKIEAV